ncbi:hypothetical protein ElyMa_003215200 [Elysia marginata]|uniref:Uncharacterized protein n=1 Tax=Elysia marginata TaxID=1093978 RepID=A0AAV4J7C2_9GAST|nr:hypothetical protein ElyMa_003215200 [Elysia marginata]
MVVQDNRNYMSILQFSRLSEQDVRRLVPGLACPQSNLGKGLIHASNEYPVASSEKSCYCARVMRCALISALLCGQKLYRSAWLVRSSVWGIFVDEAP